ncbi:hypothetical protein [Lichenicola sp.]|uniref:hypothetical protein n=1 Tax=Lichenicola sp. TaxID=2804529 RepID=UPI003B00C57B
MMRNGSTFIAALLAVVIFRTLQGGAHDGPYWFDLVAASSGTAITWVMGRVFTKPTRRRRYR